MMRVSKGFRRSRLSQFRIRAHTRVTNRPTGIIAPPNSYLPANRQRPTAASYHVPSLTSGSPRHLCSAAGSPPPQLFPTPPPPSTRGARGPQPLTRAPVPAPQEGIAILSRPTASDTELLAALQALQVLVEPIDNANGGAVWAGAAGIGATGVGAGLTWA